MNGSTDPTGEQIAAARLRIVLDAKLGRHTPERIWRLAGASLSDDDMDAADPVKTPNSRRSTGDEPQISPPRAAELERSDRLSVAEITLVECVAQGLSNRQIALRLDISEKTVGARLTRLVAKTGVTSRDELPSIFNDRQSSSQTGTDA